MGDNTDEAVALRLRELLLRWDKTPVIVRKDLPGQLANRVLQAIIREAINIVATGLATAEDVDTAIKMGMALRFPVGDRWSISTRSVWTWRSQCSATSCRASTTRRGRRSSWRALLRLDTWATRPVAVSMTGMSRVCRRWLPPEIASSSKRYIRWRP